MTVRIPPLQRAEWDEAVITALRMAFPPDAAALYLSDSPDAPRMPNALATLVHNPNVAGPFLAFNNVLLRDGALSPRLRELMVLRVAWLARSEYEWVQHARLASRYEITAEEVAAIAEGNGTWTAIETDVIAATNELMSQQKVEDKTWQRLAAELSEAELVELVFVVGTYASLAMVFNSIGVELDPELDPTIAPAIPN